MEDNKMEKPIVEKTEVIVEGRTVVLDPDRMNFNEANLSEYMSTEYSWIDYFGKQLELATKELALAEGKYETLYNKKFVEAKDEGGSDNYAKAKAGSDSAVAAAYEYKVERKAVVGLLKSHLKAWDKNHDNAQNRGYNLRAEMKYLNRSSIAEETTGSFEDYLKEVAE